MPHAFAPFTAAVLFGALGIAALPSFATPVLVKLTVNAAQRCPHCGWIESKRQIVSSLAEPHSLGVYEYTVRMADGSSRIFRETLPATWRLGERLTLIDGTDRR